MKFRRAVVIAIAAGAAAPLEAQHAPGLAQPHESHGRETRPLSAAGGIHVVPLATHVTPILAGTARTEAYVSQPTLLGRVSALGDAFELIASISLEGLTLDRGELGAGSHGEGYVDRRHPHTYLHELVLTARHDFGFAAASISAGRGFAPFGTDDPMMRPFVKFPVNHHLAQVLERVIAIGAIRTGPVLLEAGVFNGTEPVGAGDYGSLERFGDSWAGRITLSPWPGIELQASGARVKSPELPHGGGLDQRKRSASARIDHAVPFGSAYALLEWNRTTLEDHGIDLFATGSVLAEIALDARGWRPALRFEHAERSEEQRLSDPFRTPWPHSHSHMLGITRWTVVSSRVERDVSMSWLTLAPFIEGSVSHVTMSTPGPFDPVEFYGDDRIWTVSVGARVQAGWHPLRMGRYGVAVPAGNLHRH